MTAVAAADMVLTVSEALAELDAREYGADLIGTG